MILDFFSRTHLDVVKVRPNEATPAHISRHRIRATTRFRAASSQRVTLLKGDSGTRAPCESGSHGLFADLSVVLVSHESSLDLADALESLGRVDDPDAKAMVRPSQGVHTLDRRRRSRRGAVTLVPPSDGSRISR